jgi:protein disulfide-isomerase-like protein
MRKIATNIFIIFQILSIVYINTVHSSNVVVLTNDDFSIKIKENSLVLVKFYAPWCWHCQNFAPIFEQTAKSVKDQKINVVLAEVDCTTQTKTCNSNQIEGYPTVKLFKNGNFLSEFRGIRTVENLINFVKQYV